MGEADAVNAEAAEADVGGADAFNAEAAAGASDTCARHQAAVNREPC